MEEGTIKFNCVWKIKEPLPNPEIPHLIRWRDKLKSLGLIGKDAYGIAYGNLSIRTKNGFIITGTGTSGNELINRHHFCLVTSADISNNRVECRGPVEASSESLTHAAAYHADSTINAIIHIHDERMWKKFHRKIPTTDDNAQYGTPEIAAEVQRLCQMQRQSFMVMGGHKNGLLFFGKDLDYAGFTALEYFES